MIGMKTGAPKSILVAMSVVLASTAPAASQEHKPNIVVMVMDNLGWGEIGVYGGGILRGARTPRLDWLNANKRPDSEHTG